MLQILVLLGTSYTPRRRSVLSDNIDSREAFAQALMLSLDEDPDTSNIFGQSRG